MTFMSQKHETDFAFTAEDNYGRHIEPTYGGALSFLRRRYTRDLTGVDVAVTGIPFDTATSNRPGARFGPRGIRAASSFMAWERLYPWEFDAFERLAVIDYGDCMFDPGVPEQVPAEIRAHAKQIIDQGPALLSLGGDHFATWPLLQAHVEKFGRLSLLHFDAHTDTWDDESPRVDHGTMFFHATKEGLIDPATSVQVGIRTTNDDTLGFNILDAPWVHDHTADETVAEIRRIIGDDPVYLTFDIDCLDPAYAPGTGTPVCGGLTTHQALSIIRRLRGLNIVGMDLMEVAPPYDSGEITALAGARIAGELISLYATSPRGEAAAREKGRL